MKNFFEIKFLLKKSKNNVVENFYYQLVMSFHNLYDTKACRVFLQKLISSLPFIFYFTFYFSYRRTGLSVCLSYSTHPCCKISRAKDLLRQIIGKYRYCRTIRRSVCSGSRNSRQLCHFNTEIL